MSGAAYAGSLPPLRIAPDLLGPARPSQQAPVPSPAPQVAPVPADQPVQARPEPSGPPSEARSGAEARGEAASAASLPASAEAASAPDAATHAVPPGSQPVPEAEAETTRFEPLAPDVRDLSPAVAGEAEAPRRRPPARPAPATASRDIERTDIIARDIIGLRGVEMIAEGDAELQRGDTRLLADRMSFNELTDEAVAEGNVRLERGADWVTGERARMIVYLNEGEVEEPHYYISSTTLPGGDDDERRSPVSGRGSADVMLLEGENQYRMVNATWTTCEPETDDWYIRASDLQLDYDREVATARGSTIVFKDVPILWWPRMTFPLAQQRQSGFLAPTMGVSNRTGLDVSVPYYWNIAPNYDATIAPRYMGRRGLQLAGEYRYLAPRYDGEARVEYLPRDGVTGDSRWLGSIQHWQRLAPGLTARLNLNAVSDDDYFEDLSSVLAVASRRNLVRDALINYTGGGWWRASARFQGFQTLEGNTPYQRLPQLKLEADRADLPLGTAMAFEGEYVNFSNPDSFVRSNNTISRPDGRRLHLYPQLSLPHVRAGYYVTPKLGLHYTRYDLEGPVVVGGRESITRSLPVFTVDSGMFFDRETSFFGRDYEQTLEPRLYYVRIPHEYQGDIPRFDTARYDFGFAQIFSENRFSGIDRVGDANQITLAVTSRLIEPESGAERLRFTVGQRYHFDDRKVSLDLVPRSAQIEPETSGRTDLLAAFTGRITQTVSVDAATQYSPSDRQTERFNVSMRYQPEHLKALNVGYRFSRDVLRDIDISGQWPLGGRWYGVGRLTRSLEESRITEAIAGLEYLSRCGCWAFRAAAHRFALDEDRATNSLFFQLELTGVGGLGPSPVNLLRRSVPGYGMITESVSDRYFGLD